MPKLCQVNTCCYKLVWFSCICRGNNSTLFLDPAMLPKISYVSMMFDHDSDTSADADALSIKYLTDDQLAELAKLRQNSSRKNSRNTQQDVTLDRLLASACGGADISTATLNPNFMSFSTKKYLERYGLLDDNDSKRKDNSGKSAKMTCDESQFDLSYGVTGESEPAILNVKQFLEKLAETSLIMNSPDRNSKGSAGETLREKNRGETLREKNRDSHQTHTDHRQLNNSVCSCNCSSHSSGTESFQGYNLPPTPAHYRQNSVNSDTTHYRTPDQSPLRQSRNSDYHQRAASDHTPIRVFNKEFRERIKNYEDQKERLHRDQSSEEVPCQTEPTVVPPHRRILDIERLKELPKLL